MFYCVCMYVHIYKFFHPAPAKVEFPCTVNIQQSPAFGDTDFNMTCTVSGSGDLMVEWQKDGKSVDADDFIVISVRVTGGKYMFGQTEAKDSTLMWKVTKSVRYFTCNNITHFDGHYTCGVSTQTAGATTRDESMAFIVNVQCKEIPLSKKFFNYRYANFRSVDVDVVLMIFCSELCSHDLSNNINAICHSLTITS